MSAVLVDQNGGWIFTKGFACSGSKSEVTVHSMSGSKDNTQTPEFNQCSVLFRFFHVHWDVQPRVKELKRYGDIVI